MDRDDQPGLGGLDHLAPIAVGKASALLSKAADTQEDDIGPVAAVLARTRPGAGMHQHPQSVMLDQEAVAAPLAIGVHPRPFRQWSVDLALEQGAAEQAGAVG